MALAPDYPTMTLEQIAALPIASIAADDCALFMYVTGPHLFNAKPIMEGWDFIYKSNVAWDKEIPGTGYWFLNRHEILLVGTSGNIPAPAPGTQWPSIIRERRRDHSQKPEAVYRMIEEYYPTLPKLELFARGPARKGWSTWGNEAIQEAAE